MVAFTCNICGASNEVEKFATEPASCACGSNVRLRALIHLLSMELFGQSLILTEFPKLRAIRGMGMTDKECYAGIMAEKFDYTNTFYDREPRLDFTEAHPELSGQYDFVLSADVLEHITPPVERAFEETHRLLKPHGFLGITVSCNAGDRLREHFPGLHEYRVVQLGDAPILVNRRRDGTVEVREDLVFHGGSGATLEMREFGVTELQAKLVAAGFREIHCLNQDLPEIGVLFDHDVSQPMVARKQPWIMDRCVRSQIMEEWSAVRRQAREEGARADLLGAQIRQASASRWVRLGRRLAVGPKFA
jgi:SAM-dependent methyltransferase